MGESGFGKQCFSIFKQAIIYSYFWDMSNRRNTLIFLIATLATMSVAYGQKMDFWAADVQVRNYGFDLGFGREFQSNKENTHRYLGLRIGNIQHPKEVFVVNQSLPASEPFIMDKINRAWVVRPLVGNEWVLAPRQSRFDLGVSFVGQIGLPLAYVWPIYIYNHQSRLPFDVVEEVKYDPSIHEPNYIGGESSFFRGFSEGRMIPGLGVNCGLSVEWGSYRNLSNTLTLGIMADIFVEEIPLLHSIAYNPQFLPALFINFAVGFGDSP